jgi:RND family efflux transporter MFP subunit
MRSLSKDMRMRLTTLAAILMLANLVTAACGGSAPEEVDSETVVPVKTDMAQLGTIRAVIHATGVVTPAPAADLLVVAPQSARVADMPKAEGDPVRRGDVLVRFDIPSVIADAEKQRAEVGRAEARIRAAQAALARARDLFERGIAARREVEDAEREIADGMADLAGARAALAAADTMASRATVRATFDGIVAKRSHNPGDLVEPTTSDAVLRVVDPSRLEVTASVPIADVSRVMTGAVARLTNNQPDTVLTVVSRPAAVEPGTAAVPIRLRLKGPTTLPVGAPVEIEIDAEEHKDVVLVPSVAVVREGEDTAVFVVSGNKAQRRMVTLGVSDDERTEVRSGLEAGETIIVDGQAGLPDGATVTTGTPGKADEDSGAGSAKTP